MAANLQMIDESMYIEESIEIAEPTEGALLNLVQCLSADQLLALPPLAVPQTVLDRVDDSARRDALRRLDELAQAPTADSRPTPPSDQEREAALTVAERADPASISALRNCVERVDAASRASRFDNPAVAVVSEDLDSARALAADASAALAVLARMEATLGRAQWDNEDRRERDSAAQASIGRLKSGIQAVLVDYHRLECALALQTMRSRYADCELEARTYRELSDQAEAIRTRLNRPSRALGWLLLRPGPSRDERERLQRRLQRLTGRQKRSHTFIEESELRQWLDVLANAGLELPFEQWRGQTQEARFLLYRLLNINRLQLIMPAHRLAATVFARGDVYIPPQRCVGGEQYLVTYFTGRGAVPPAGHGWGYTDGVDGLGQVRATMLAEYRSETPSG